ncbi:alpha-E domain-containing protein [Neptunomonas phycophila]|jgi:uncharacterized alpha-E superfamily protein|uniref:Alpha-E domain-containing protein n=1 Tax=Neptunomonas phycophila TaxID=1572645 RepID=A0AAW7XGX5_9GAMM|nr:MULTISPECIES: alpha-E domain-containing protein [Neptunomonas]MBT3146052.1 alpha-E domain-containing protein [Neptunomonas phycophila]MDN2659795.1 alpha-E domain-containing protein [Neptunomonas sp. CHC150]MDO6452317.1 alpha-E domain-containing protein [Neptunomonas phycophila]MDO6466921.1 alpha-E domain-containing protein [Neptunomonas phycophila]MDO6783276.1 alpha-E domain-containing protein [Neptunomonas phycophila]
MLSRVAERIYWCARYLERVENTARLVSVYDNLLFDLPHDFNIGWYNLITINSGEQAFDERYKIRDERNVVKFLLADDTNFSSMLVSLKMVRENMRTTRDVVPQETWELINELDLFARKNIKQGINRTQRHDYLNTIIKGCQEINGLLAGAMSRDATWQFVMLGRNLERADMTTRILDAGVSIMLQPDESNSVNLGQVVWGNVLRSSSAYLSYRRSVRTSVSGAKVARYLLSDTYFPRAASFCVNEIKQAATKLPRSQGVLKVIEKIDKLSYPITSSSELDEAFRNYLNDFQINLNELNAAISENWFAFDEGAAA